LGILVAYVATASAPINAPPPTADIIQPYSRAPCPSSSRARTGSRVRAGSPQMLITAMLSRRTRVRGSVEA
jgi:hypothetical protein